MSGEHPEMGPADKEPPEINEPRKWVWKHLRLEQQHLLSAPLAFVLIGLGGIVIGWWLTWQIVVPSKNATIETLQTSVNEARAKTTQLQRDNEALAKENLELKSAMADHAMPVKKRARILSFQLSVLSKAFDANLAENQAEYFNRFSDRVFRIISEFDEAGQHSDALTVSLTGQVTAASLKTISTELERLATNLKD